MINFSNDFGIGRLVQKVCEAFPTTRKNYLIHGIANYRKTVRVLIPDCYIIPDYRLKTIEINLDEVITERTNIFGFKHHGDNNKTQTVDIGLDMEIRDNPEMSVDAIKEVIWGLEVPLADIIARNFKRRD